MPARATPIAEPSTPITARVEQLRADVLSDLLLTADPTAAPRSPQPITAVVQVVVPVLTLLGARDGHGPAGLAGPAELVGKAPIDTATARRLAGSAAGWDRILTHPVTGTVLAVDRYRPSQQQRRHLRARDERCRFPGCRMPVHRCDIDHTTDAALGGVTSPCNLAHLCRRHHSLKHATDWTVTQHPDGTLEWTSPTGRIHLDHPPSTV
ncbi:UNVERIFIED_CONTAM: HNH endonuclease, partial [Microbacterium sp. SLM126]